MSRIELVLLAEVSPYQFASFRISIAAIRVARIVKSAKSLRHGRESSVVGQSNCTTTHEYQQCVAISWNTPRFGPKILAYRSSNALHSVSLRKIDAASKGLT
jgi:hypothetical protein